MVCPLVTAANMPQQVWASLSKGPFSGILSKEIKGPPNVGGSPMRQARILPNLSNLSGFPFSSTALSHFAVPHRHLAGSSLLVPPQRPWQTQQRLTWLWLKNMYPKWLARSVNGNMD